MLRSLPDERLSQPHSAAFFAPLPQAGGVERSHVPPFKGGPDCAAIVDAGDRGKVGTRFARPTPTPPLKGRG